MQIPLTELLGDWLRHQTPHARRLPSTDTVQSTHPNSATMVGVVEKAPNIIGRGSGPSASYDGAPILLYITWRCKTGSAGGFSLLWGISVQSLRSNSGAILSGLQEDAGGSRMMRKTGGGCRRM